MVTFHHAGRTARPFSLPQACLPASLSFLRPEALSSSPRFSNDSGCMCWASCALGRIHLGLFSFHQNFDPGLYLWISGASNPRMGQYELQDYTYVYVFLRVLVNSSCLIGFFSFLRSLPQLALQLGSDLPWICCKSDDDCMHAIHASHAYHCHHARAIVLWAESRKPLHHPTHLS